MSQRFSHVLHPFDIAHHPDPEPEVKRAILASWAAGRPAMKDPAPMRRLRRATPALPADDTPSAIDARDGAPGQNRSVQ